MHMRRLTDGEDTTSHTHTHTFTHTYAHTCESANVTCIHKARKDKFRTLNLVWKQQEAVRCCKKSKLRHKSFFPRRGKLQFQTTACSTSLKHWHHTGKELCFDTHTRTLSSARRAVAVAPPAASLSGSLTFKGFEHRENEEMWRGILLPSSLCVLLSSTRHSFAQILQIKHDSPASYRLSLPPLRTPPLLFHILTTCKGIRSCCKWYFL